MDTHARRPRLSVRLKLTLWMLAIFSVLQLSSALIILLYQRSSISRYFDDRLVARAESMIGEVRRARFDVTDRDLQRIAEANLRFVMIERFCVALFADDGRVVASTLRPAPTADDVALRRAAPASPTAIFRAVVPGMNGSGEERTESRILLERMEAPDGRHFVLALVNSDHYFEAMTGLATRVLVISLAIGAAAAGIAGWMIAGLAAAPIHELRRIAGSLAPELIERHVALPAKSQEIGALEKDLQDVRSKLVQALHAQDRFISNVSHELRTPIAVLLTEGQTLRSDQLPPEGRRFVQSVTEEMRRLGRMVESFLTLTKLRGGKAMVSGSVCDVNDFVMEAVAGCHKMAAQYGVSLAPDLVMGDHSPRVHGVAELLRVMVDNLLRNAIRFSPKGQKVVVRVADLQDRCEVAVRDQGPGVPEDVIEKVFDQFVQSQGESVRGRGHGLGLSISQGIAELHGGTIAVRNMPEGGCEFTVSLPVAADPPLPAAPASAGPAAEAEHAGEGRGFVPDGRVQPRDQPDAPARHAAPHR